MSYILQHPAGGCRIELLQYIGEDGGRLPVGQSPAALGLRHFAVRVEDIEVVAAALRDQMGIIMDIVDVPAGIVRGGKRMAYVRDPDSVIVELSQYAEADPVFCGSI